MQSSTAHRVRLDPAAHEAIATAYEERARVWAAKGEQQRAKMEQTLMVIHQRAAQIKRSLVSTARDAQAETA